jgi:hypothetical protein
MREARGLMQVATIVDRVPGLLDELEIVSIRRDLDDCGSFGDLHWVGKVRVGGAPHDFEVRLPRQEIEILARADQHAFARLVVERFRQVVDAKRASLAGAFA